ncbi:uncharacterized protein ACWYII_034841 [Salvelinus alpinus]
MCLSIPVLSSLHRPYKRFTPRGRGHPNLVVPARTTHVESQVSGSLWNCRSAANKAEFISAYASLQSLDFLALTETWITTDNTATPTALSSSAHVFSHTPRASGQRGGGTGILISPKWSFSLSPLTHLSIASFEFHAVTVTSPFKLNILIIYRPPGSLGEFINELDALISSFPEDGSPLTVLGDFNLPTSTFDSFLSASFFPLLSSFDLTLSPSPPTHKAGNTLDLIFTRCCSSTNLIATPLQVSDPYLVSFSLSLSSITSHTAPTRMVSRRPNLRSLSPATLSSSILSSLPSAQTFSNLSPDSASSTLLSSLSASFDSLCPLSSRPARSSPPAPWLDDSLRAHRTGLRAAERKWRKTRLPADLASFHSLLSTFSSSVSAAKATFYHSKFQASASNPRKLFATFSSLLNPPPPPPPSSLSADDFVNHFEKKVDDIRSSFAKSNDTAGSAHTALPCALTSFSPLSPDEISRLVTAGRPTTCPLDPIPSSLLQTISGDLLPYLTSLINSSLTAGYVPSVFKRARVAPLLKKPTLDPSDVNNYRPVSLLSFLSKTLERAVLGQLSRYLSQNDLLDPNQSGFKTSHSTETALLCITEALRTAKANSLSSALILLDLSAAFDTVNHQILLSTLSELGISGAAHAWIASYLTGRSYQVANRISACLADISVWMTDHHLKLNLAPEVYHKTIYMIFEHISGVETMMDDITIWGSTKEEHDARVRQALDLTWKVNLKLNKDKCEFGVNTLTFVGDVLSEDGVKPDPRKTSAVNNMERPKNKDDVRRFMGMITYIAKLILQLSAQSAPLRCLLEQKNEWECSHEQENCFKILKKTITEEPVLRFYDPEKSTRISADESQFGLGAVLLQHDDTWQPVTYASRALTGAETRYAQIEKELLVSTYACERFHQYVYGRDFEVGTDHKPLVSIMSKPLNDCPMRIQRMLIRLQKYDVKMIYTPGKFMFAADTLSQAVDKKESFDTQKNTEI